MEIRKKVILRKIAGQDMLVPIGDTVFEYNGIFLLTESGRFLWENITAGCNKQELCALLADNYSIDKETATQDVDEFLAKLQELDFIGNVN